MVNELTDEVADNEFDRFLNGLKKLGILSEDTSTTRQTFHIYRKNGCSVEDCVEIAFARLHAPHIAILYPSRYQAFFAVSEQQVKEGQQTVSLLLLQERLFNQLGILPPEFVPSLSNTVETIMVKLNDRVIPLSFEDAPSSTMVTEALYDTIAQNAEQLINIDTVDYMLAQLHSTYPVLVMAVLQGFTLGSVTRTLRTRLRRGASPLDLRLFLERLLDPSFASLPESAA